MGERKRERAAREKETERERERELVDEEVDGDDTELKNKARRGPSRKSGKRRHTSHSKEHCHRLRKAVMTQAGRSLSSLCLCQEKRSKSSEILVSSCGWRGLIPC